LLRNLVVEDIILLLVFQVKNCYLKRRRSKIEEIWENIEGYDGIYQISNFGNIKSFKRYKDGKILTPKKDKDGYLQIGLRDNNSKRKFYSVHRLVAVAFIPNTLNLPDINHKDSITYHNSVDNLEWCSKDYNNKYRFSNGNANHKGEKHPTTKLTNEQAKQIYLLGHSGKYTELEVAKMFNTTRSVVNKIRLGYRWSTITRDIKIIK